jgi:sialate O-acetylesterase
MRHFFAGSLLIWAAACAPRGEAPLRLHALFSDHMVLQQGRNVPVWGWAAPGTRVTLQPDWGAAVVVRADDNGRWTAWIDTPEAGGPATLTVSTRDTSVTVRDIRFGEVWLASGQSNMEMPLAGWLPDNPIDRSAEEIATAAYPEIRMFTVARAHSDAREADVSGRWTVFAPDSVAWLSATAYFFAKDLHAALDVPVGVIQSSWGGTPAEAWVAAEELSSFTFPAADVPQSRPSALFNGMIAPLMPFAIQGVIWYQGESNVGHGKQYETLFPTLIRNWRAEWSRPELPFYYVQIAPFKYGEGEPSPAAELREAQRLTLSLPHTGMVVTTDIGDPDNIHPSNKHDVGGRLALWAMAESYGKDVVHSGPLADDAEFTDQIVVIRFKHTGSGLVAKGGPLTDFELAGADGVFHPAQAVIIGETVVVRSAAVTQPVSVRFGWREAARPNLFNKEGLPASGFILGNPS